MKMTKDEAKQSLEKWLQAELLLAGIGPHDALKKHEVARMQVLFREGVMSWLQEKNPEVTDVYVDFSFTMDEPMRMVSFEFEL